MRTVLDAQPGAAPGQYVVELPDGSAPDVVQEAVLKPLNAKLGGTCFTVAGSTATDVNVAVSAQCATPQMRTKLEGEAPAGMRMPVYKRGTV
jgi:hypothetical protein